MNDEPTAAAALAVEPGEITDRQKRLALSVISTCHTLNHLQYSITSVIFPVMMRDIGFGLLQLGFISALSRF
ncbi:MAG: hypothetical protein HYY82_18370, partial [Deltaproteobacteria bacterium]|nr:hypothetical protein [Deltaproteobacteria bacterium]